MDEVAKEALISRATAYRYFPNIDALLAEVPVDLALGDSAEVFAGRASDDPEERVDEAEAFMHRVAYQNETLLRVMLANSITRRLKDDALPKRQNRRSPLIEAALAPSRHRFRDGDYKKLCASLAMIFGTEAMIVFRDVLRLDEKTAREVKSWAVRALVRAALDSSKSPAVPTKFDTVPDQNPQVATIPSGENQLPA